MTFTVASSASGPAAQGEGPLSGIRVLELGSLIAGPFAGRLLGDWGADVLKVESPDSPDPMRQWGQGELGGQQVWWLVQSRNKRVVTVDLRTGDGQARLLDLAARSDVLVENFRPGTLEHWNIGPEQLWQRNPGLIIARISAFGQTGSRAGLAGYASVAEAMGGLRYLNGHPGEAPPRMGLSIGDSLGALFAFQGILAALYWRDARAGHGQIVDVSLAEACLALTESVIPEYAATGAVRGPSGSGLRGIAPSNVFRTRDGKWIVIAANQDTVFARLAQAMGEPRLPADPRFSDHRARGVHQSEIESIVAAWASRLTASELVEVLEAAGVPHGLVYSAADVVNDAMFRERDALLPISTEVGEVLMPGIVPKLSATPGAIRWAGPVRPADNEQEVGRWLSKPEADQSRAT